MSKIKALEQDWDDLAKIDPMWAIVSDPKKIRGKWDYESFFESGKKRVAHFLNIIQDSGTLLTPGIALDFGCGMGRLSQALAAVFNTCYGIDISPEMIRLAEKYNRAGEKCKYILNEKGDLSVFDNNFFDLVFSDNVLQHIPPELTKSYLKEFIRVLRPQGVLIFQIPLEFTHVDQKTIELKKLPKFHPRRIINKLKGILIGHNESDRYYRLIKLGFSKEWLHKKFGFRPKIEMYRRTESELSELMAQNGAKIVRVVKENDPGVISGILVVVKSQ